jgi:hypothetical protein
VSVRTDPALAAALCARLGYRLTLFHADVDGLPPYHTNVLLSVGDGYAVWVPDAVVETALADIVDQSPEVGEIVRAAGEYTAAEDAHRFLLLFARALIGFLLLFARALIATPYLWRPSRAAPHWSRRAG